MNRGLLGHPHRKSNAQTYTPFTPLSNFTAGELGWPQDDHFDQGESIDTAGSRFLGATAWEPVNIGTSVYGRVGSRIVLEAVDGNMQGFRTPMPPATSRWAAILGGVTQNGIGAQYNITNLGMSDTVTGRIYGINYVVSPSGRFELAYWTSPTTFNSSAGIAYGEGSFSSEFCLAIACNGTTATFWHSRLGETRSWQQVGSAQTMSTLLGGVTPNSIGFYSKRDVARCVSIVDYFRIVPYEWVVP